MKQRDASKGTLVCKRDGSFWGEIIDINEHGHGTVLSYFDDCHHYINLKRLVQPIDKGTRKTMRYVIEPDDGQFYAHIPFFKGCHTAGRTINEAYGNLKDAIHAYIRTMRKFNEVGLRKNRWDSWYYN